MMVVVNWINKQIKGLGPGFITGAADNDPSAITTYSIVGAQFGLKLSWMAIFLTPVMIVLQGICARIGMTSGRGLTGTLIKHYSKGWVWTAISLLTVGTVINIGADLGFMAAVMQMILGFPFWYWLAVWCLFLVAMEVVATYRQYSRYLKYLALTLGVYLITAMMVHQDWGLVIKSSLIPQFEINWPFLMAVVAFLGTTISPYLFFWQASEEVEEEIDSGKIKDFGNRPLVSKAEILGMELDTKLGMIFSNLISWSIVIVAAATLNAGGVVNLESPAQIAQALSPLAGRWSVWLFAIGIIGISLQSIPILAGSLAYAWAELLGWKEGLSKTFNQARNFYYVIGISTVAGALINGLGINPVRGLYYSSIINGIVAIPLMVMIIKLADDEKVVGKYKSKGYERVTAWATLAIMVATTGLLIVGRVFNLD